MDVPAHHNPPTTALPAVARIDFDNRALLTCDEELVHRNIIADKSARQMIAATRRALDVKATPTVATERSLLLYQPANRHGGYVAFGVGDLTAATHLTITVPGFRGAPQRRAVTLVQDTENLLAATTLHTRENVSEPVRTAAIAWIGYRPPTVRQLPTLGPAAAGARNLTTFLRNITPLLPNLHHITVVGHSYGGVVTALAVNDNPLIDKAVLAGAPGAPLFTTSRTAEIYIVTAPHDRIPALKWFTPTTPITHRVHNVAQPAAANGRGHRTYFKPGTAALDAIAQIAAGAQPAENDTAVTNVPVGGKLINFAHRLIPTPTVV